MEITLKPNYTFSEYSDSFGTFLKQRGSRYTHEKNIILHSVYEQDKSFTVDSLRKHLYRKNRYVSESTVYNTLNLLVESRLVLKHQFTSQEIPQYEKFNIDRTHNYIYIEDTQTVIEFSDSRVEEIINDMAKKYNVSPLRHSFVIYGNKIGKK